MQATIRGQNRQFLSYIAGFVILLIIACLLTLNTPYGLALLAFASMVCVALLKPKALYFLMLAMLPVENLSLIPNVSYARLLGLFLVVGLALRFAISKSVIPKDNAYNYYLFFFAGAVVSFIFARDLSTSVRMFLTYVSLFMFYVLGRYFIRSLSDINMCLNILFSSTVISFFYLQSIGLAHRAGTWRVGAGAGDSNAYAFMLLALVPLVLYRALTTSGLSRILHWLFFGMFTVFLIFSGSRGGYLGFLGAAGVLAYHYGIRRLKVLVFSFLIVGCVIFFISPDEFWDRASMITASEGVDSSIDIRLNHYRAALRMILDHPIAGVGIYNFQHNNLDYGDTRVQVVHNMYLEILSGGGVLSFIPFVLILINCWRRLDAKNYTDKYVRDIAICTKAAYAGMLIAGVFLSCDYAKILWFMFALISSVYYMRNSYVKLDDMAVRS